MIPPDQGSDPVPAAACRIAAEQGWARVTPTTLARATGLPLVTLRRNYPDRLAILRMIMAAADEAVLAAPADPQSSPRDNLFDVIMRRIDALAPYKPGLAALVRPGSDPALLVRLLPELHRSMGWMLAAAGLDDGDWRTQLKIQGLLALYIVVFRSWLNDDSPDLGRTMKALDSSLSRVEPWADRLTRLASGR